MPPTSPPAVHWQCLPFDALSTQQLYALLRLRSEVFVVEQACIFQDLDGLDQQAMHLLGLQGAELLASARYFPKGVTFAEASIGRVVVSPGARGSGLGHQLMVQALACLQAEWGAQSIRIGAQAHLRDFYASHGFEDVGRPYIEDGIPHLEMLRSS